LRSLSTSSAPLPTPPTETTLDIVHGGQHHHDERCFMPVHVYHVESGKPAVVILRTGKTPAGREERTVIKHVTRRIRRHWPKTRICWRAIFGQQSHLPYQF
jgi:hypothetical protein